MTDAFKQALSPAKAKCLGLELKPLTLGHVRLLLREDVAFVSGGSATLPDLVLAVFICSQDWKAAEKALSSWWDRPFFRLWGWYCRKLIFPQECRAFLDYFGASTSLPAIKTIVTASNAGTASRDFASPFYFRLVARMIGTLGQSWERAHDTTVAEANCLWCSFAEIENKIQLWTPQELELFEEVERRSKEAA